VDEIELKEIYVDEIELEKRCVNFNITIGPVSKRYKQTIGVVLPFKNP